MRWHDLIEKVRKINSNWDSVYKSINKTMNLNGEQPSFRSICQEKQNYTNVDKSRKKRNISKVDKEERVWYYRCNYKQGFISCCKDAFSDWNQPWAQCTRK